MKNYYLTENGEKHEIIDTKHIDLSFKDIVEVCITDLPNVQTLYLRNNQLTSFECDLPNVQRLYLDIQTTINGNIKGIDGIPTIVKSSKTVGDYDVFVGEYKSNGEQVYVAIKDNKSAHGDTLQEAISDVNFKILSENFDVDDIVGEIRSSNIVTVEQYRLLTGACKSGTAMFMSENNIKDSELPLDKVLELTVGAYGGERFRELVG